MKNIFALFFFLIAFFLFSTSQINFSYAATYNPDDPYKADGTCSPVPCVQECSASAPSCVGAWGNWIRMTDGHEITREDVTDIMNILRVAYPDLYTSTAGLLAYSDLTTILLNHIDDEWNTALLTTLQREINEAANCRSTLGGIVSGCVYSTVNFNSILPPCTRDDDNNCRTIDTAIGTIYVDPELFIRDLLKIILSISGGILVILIILSGYQLMTSQGDPEKVKAARERLTSAIIGLLFIIFSFVIYQFIASNVLNLPGFN